MKPLIILLFVFPVFAFGQSKDYSVAVNKAIDELFQAWNTHDFSLMARNSTPDLNWVNIFGTWWTDREMVVSHHTERFNAQFNGVKFEKKKLSIREVADDVVIANLIMHVGEFYPPDGIDRGNNKREATDDILTIVFVRKENKWLMTAAQNTVINPTIH